MDPIEQKVNSETAWRRWTFNILGLLVIFAILLLLRVPIFINADYFFLYDEAQTGSQILDLLEGGPIHFYFEGENYAGIVLGLAAAPFFWLFGVSAFAFKLPGTLAYALYILSSYWVVKKIHPSAALTTIFLMIFSPYIILIVSSNNWQHNLIIFFGNIIFLLFFRCKESDASETTTIFLLGMVLGFSIYSYTYSILYIASIAILFVLTHKHWSSVRNKFSARRLLAWWKGQKSGKLKIVRILDCIVIIFVGAIVFSYVFGGFGIDIAGYSILQINNIHKPVGQVLIIIIVRLILFRDDINWKTGCEKILAIFAGIAPIRLMIIGIFGFAIGISPRIASILTGETTRGGQGFDVDFNPLQLTVHIWQLITYYLPEFFDVRQPLVSFFNAKWSSMVFVRGVLAALMVFLIIKSAVYFFSLRFADIKSIAQFKSLKLEPGLVFLIFPVLVCVAVVILKNGADLRYLLPLHGVVSIWVAIYLDKIRLESKTFFAGFLFVWCGFGLLNTYVFYTNPMINYPQIMKGKIIRDFSVFRYPNSYAKLVVFCKDKKISRVYSDSATTAQLNFFGHGDIIAAAYDKKKTSRRKYRMLSSAKIFSVIVSEQNEHHLQVFKEYLDKSSIIYSQEVVNDKFWVLNNFVGDSMDVDSLRNLIPKEF